MKRSSNARFNELPPENDLYSDLYNGMDGLDTFLSIQDVLHHVGIGKTTVYKLMNAGYFPKSFHIQGTTTVVWSYSDIKEWMDKQKNKNIRGVEQ